MIPTSLCREVADAVPGAQYVEIPDAGHFGYLEQPETVNQLILDFLAERSLRASVTAAGTPPSAPG
jgi:pimeloyl-ACP methyl ester carboxylesterase